MRPLLVAVLLVAPLAGCVTDAPPGPLTPSAVAPMSEPEATAPTEPRATPESTPPAAEPSPSPPPPQASAPAAPPSPVYVVERRFGNVTAGAGAATPGGEVCCVATSPADETVAQTAAVAYGATAFVVELRWTTPREEAAFDLDLVVMAPDYRERDASAPSTDIPPETPDPSNASLYTGHRFAATDIGGGLARIVVDDPAVLALAGEWTIEVAPKGPAAAVPFQIALTSVLRLPPTADYSAFA